MAWRVYVTTALIISIFSGYSSAGTIYVDANSALGGDGTTWGTAYKYLQDALYKPPTSGDEIWVAEGTYKPDQDEGGNVTLGDRNATFELKEGVSFYGGFPIGGGTWEERDPHLHETILSGDLNGDDGPDFANTSENSYNISHIDWATGTTTLDGFVFKGGSATGSPDPVARLCRGAALCNRGGGSVNLYNCSFTQNKSLQGGAIYLHLVNNSLIKACTFTHNDADYFFYPTYTGIEGQGGVLYFYGSSPTFIDCDFSENIAAWGGVLMCDSFGGWPEFERYCNPKFINTEFINNKVYGSGGVLENHGEGHPVMINCKFIANRADYDAGVSEGDGVFQTAQETFTNCTIVGNTAGRDCGAIGASTETHVYNSIVWGNKDSSGINERSQIELADSDVTSSCIQDDDPDDSYIPFGGAANNNIDDNPKFTRDPYDGGDGWGVGDNDDYGNLRLQHTSPCIDTADNASVPADSNDLDEDLNTTEPIPYDLDGHPRIVDGDCNSTDIVDMGAYEFSYTYLGDFAGGCDVDFADFAVFASAWLTEEGQAGYDPNCDIAVPYDGAIDEKDLQVFTDNWLLGR